MFDFIIRFAVEAIREFQVDPGEVLEIGSYNINGTIRDAFQPGSTRYVGIDSSLGPDVDLVLSSHTLEDRFSPKTFDTVVCCEMLEHDIRPWVTVAQINKVLKVGGILFVSTPTFGFHLHRHPVDCYRYGEDAYRLFIFENYEILRLELIQNNICCIGMKLGDVGRNGTLEATEEGNTRGGAISRTPKISYRTRKPDKGLSSRLVIRKAMYGDLVHGKSIDVTQVVTALLSHNRLMMKAANYHFGDPVVGVVKQLCVEYSIDGVEKKQTIFEGQSLNISAN